MLTDCALSDFEHMLCICAILYHKCYFTGVGETGLGIWYFNGCHAVITGRDQTAVRWQGHQAGTAPGNTRAVWETGGKKHQRFRWLQKQVVTNQSVTQFCCVLFTSWTRVYKSWYRNHELSTLVVHDIVSTIKSDVNMVASTMVSITYTTETWQTCPE